MKKFIAGAASLMLCMGLHAQDFRINPSGYFENGGANVMVFSDVYPEGHQGGLTLVLNGDRRAAGGDVRFEISQGQWQGLPKMRKRVVDEAANEIRVTLSYPDSAKHMADLVLGLLLCHNVHIPVRLQHLEQGHLITSAGLLE